MRRVGRQQTVLRPYAYGLTDFPDGSIGVYHANGFYHWLLGVAGVGPYWTGTSTYHFTGKRLESMRPSALDPQGNAIPLYSPGADGSFDDLIAANGSAFVNPSSGRVYFWYQAMKNIPDEAARAKEQTLGPDPASYPAYGSIGLAVSDDGGETFTRAGQALLINLSEAQFVGDPAIGHADPTPPAVVRNGNYLYMYHLDYLSEAPWGALAVARLPIADLDESPQPWKKYYREDFTEPGLTGRFTRIVSRVAFPTVTYNTYLKRWFMVHTWEDWRLYYRISRDGIWWSRKRVLLVSRNRRNWIVTPTVMGMRRSPQLTGRSFWLYYGHAPNERAEPGAFLVRRKITVMRRRG